MTTSQSPDETRPFFSRNSLAHLADHLSAEGERPAANTFTKNAREEWTRRPGNAALHRPPGTMRREAGKG